MAVWLQTGHWRNLNLAVRNGIAIRIYYASKTFWRILIWQLQDGPPNLIPHQIFRLYGSMLDVQLSLPILYSPIPIMTLIGISTTFLPKVLVHGNVPRQRALSTCTHIHAYIYLRSCTCIHTEIPVYIGKLFFYHKCSLYRLRNPLRSPFGMYGRTTRIGSVFVTTLSSPSTLGWLNLANM